LKKIKEYKKSYLRKEKGFLGAGLLSLLKETGIFRERGGRDSKGVS